MEIHHFPQVQILGNHAKIREGKHYIDLGIYNGDGTFEWSPEGIARRDALLQDQVVEPPVEYDDAAAPDFYASLPVYPETEEPTEVEDPLDAKLAEARERNAARNRKQARRGR